MEQIDKKGTLTLCDKKLVGDIPQYKIKSIKELIELVVHWLETKDENKSVFVCFQGFRENRVDNAWRDEYTSFLVSHSKEDIEDFVSYQVKYREISELEFAIFEFESYQEAFGYCKDLQESF